MIQALGAESSDGSRLARMYFERALAEGRLSHAYLFAGPRGSGKRAFVLELAQLLLCQTRSACGVCHDCLMATSGNHPGVHFFGPAEGKTQIDVDTVRSLCDRTHFKSQTYTLLALEEAERLNEPAANALLKTLEEPPPRTVIVLTAQSTGALLSTIVSRCHRIPFSAPGFDSGAVPAEGGQELSLEELDGVLEEATSPAFFANQDIKGWLTGKLPSAGGARDALRRLLDATILRRRQRLEAFERETLDGELLALGELLDLRWAIDANVNPELVLERLLRLLRRGPLERLL